MGVATLVSTIVALSIAHRATLLAKAVEDQRQAAEEARDERDAKTRLQLMAIEEARALTRWVNVAANDRHWEHQKLEDVGAAAHGNTLAAEARALLQQSLVPAAEELLELTELEIVNFHTRVPDPMYMPDRVVSAGGYFAQSEMLSRIPPFRKERALINIRFWALDPSGAQSEIHDELYRAEHYPDAFWDYRQTFGEAGLKPLSDLPRPPAMAEERKRFFRDEGLIAGE